MVLKNDFSSLKDVVTACPIEALILWSKLRYSKQSCLSKWDEKIIVSRRQVVKIYYTALGLATYHAINLHQKGEDVIVETSFKYEEFSQCLKLDGEYRSKTYMPSLMELSRLAARYFILTISKVEDIDSFNEASKRLIIPKGLIDYISFKDKTIKHYASNET